MMKRRASRFILFIPATVLMLWASAPGFASVPVAEYLKRLDDASRIIHDGLVRTYRKNAQPCSANSGWIPSDHLLSTEAETFRLIVPIAETVESRGETFGVDNTYLHNLLSTQQNATNCSTSLQTLTTLDEELVKLRKRIESFKAATAEGVPRGDAAKLADILSRSDFHIKKEESTWRQRLQEWLIAQFEAFVRKFFPSFGGVQSSGYARWLRYVLWGILVVFVGGVGWIVWKRLRTRSNKEATRGERVILGETIDETVTVDDLLTVALDLARNGEYRQAVRKIYIALLYQLDERRVIRIEPGKTNREYLNAVREQIGVYRPMRELTDRFDQFWYGQIETHHDDYERFLGTYREAVGAIPGKVVSGR